MKVKKFSFFRFFGNLEWYKKISIFFVAAMIVFLPPILANGREQEHRVNILDAIKGGYIDAQISGKESVDKLEVTLTLKTSKKIVAVVPPGTYFVADSKRDIDAFWSTDWVTVTFYPSVKASLDIPVVKNAIEGTPPKKELGFTIAEPPNERNPRLLEFMLKDAMPHAAKQIAVAVTFDPSLTRDKIDSIYYTRIISHPILLPHTKEAVSQDDPVYAFIALKKFATSLKDVKLYSELVSLVHALGSSNATVRDFALSEIITLGAINNSFGRSRDYVGALITFTKNDNLSIRHRAILGLEGKSDRRILKAVIPFITDDRVIYTFPGYFMGIGTSRTIRDAAISLLRLQRNNFETDLIPLLSSENYKVRIAAINIFSGVKKERIKSILTKLSKEDEYKEVRETAAKALELYK